MRSNLAHDKHEGIHCKKVGMYSIKFTISGIAALSQQVESTFQNRRLFGLIVLSTGHLAPYFSHISRVPDVHGRPMLVATPLIAGAYGSLRVVLSPSSALSLVCT